MPLLVPGVAMFACALVLDLLFRRDLSQAGQHSQWWINGAFDYQQVAEKNGLTDWAVACLWTLYACEIALRCSAF
jgi:hypothetical protein